ncbi:Myb/SANT-like DNA-binding domain [Popillia japonica]|uniref:Myb/SANT-like DNA-binding domain n=1 Tax=Popillia japonica TaxID=7064 RepID=A0AAW1IC99_POPJA
MHKTKGPNWTEREIQCFLDLCIDKQILDLMDSKKYRHVEIFNSLTEEMRKKGFCKTAEQMQLKFKKLKQEYRKCKDNVNKSGAAPKYMQFFKELELLFSTRPACEVTEGEVDTVAFEFVETPIDDISEDADEDNEVQSSVQDDVEDADSREAIEPPKKRSRGRKSYVNILSSYSNNLLKRQNSLLKNVLAELTQNQTEVLKNVMEDQRKWEREMLEQEHEFQKQQNELFLTTLQTCIKNMHSKKMYCLHEILPTDSANGSNQV